MVIFVNFLKSYSFLRPSEGMEYGRAITTMVPNSAWFTNSTLLPVSKFIVV